MPHVVCQNSSCAQSFHVSHNRLENGRGKYCSKACWHSLTAEERFWNFVTKTSHCWIWNGYRDSKGYGRFGIATSINIKAHRYSYMLAYGPIADKTFICHNCFPLPDNPSCVNPLHLWPGTNQANIADAVRKGKWHFDGRSSWLQGEKSPNARLRTEDILHIRALEGIMPATEVAKLFPVGDGSVRNIWKRRTWKHIP